MSAVGAARLVPVRERLHELGVTAQQVEPVAMWGAASLSIRSGARVAEVVADGVSGVSVFTWTDPGDGSYPVDMAHARLVRPRWVAARVAKWVGGGGSL